ncbi:MAG: ABC transporter substrate-binding protein [Cellulomonas sp.]
MRIALVTVASVALAAGCASGSTASRTGTSDTITVWDYYGASTPIKPAIEAFTKAHPEIKVDYQAFDYQTMQDKFSVAASSGDAPDLATLDMTWVPTYATNGVLSDIAAVSGGMLNGKPIADQYSASSNAAMTYDEKMVVALYDFDAYALYYRKDVLQSKGVAVPKTWDELVAAAKAIAEDTNGDGKPDRFAFQVLPDTFHFSQLLFQNGGTILDAKGKASFNQPAGVSAIQSLKTMLDSGGGIYWGDDQGDSTGMPGIKDERIAMFLNGPYMMGVLKSGAASQSGEWAVAPAPFAKEPGSYLGGTGLAIPAAAKNPKGAWELAQYLLEPEQQQLLYTQAGAAPATLAAQQLSALTSPDPYFGGQAPFSIFADALTTAHPYPYVASWPDIDRAITDAATAVLLGKQSPQEALDAAAKATDAALNG